MVPLYIGYGLFTAGVMLAVPADHSAKGADRRVLGVLAGLLLLAGFAVLGFTAYKQFV